MPAVKKRTYRRAGACSRRKTSPTRTHVPAVVKINSYSGRGGSPCPPEHSPATTRVSAVLFFQYLDSRKQFGKPSAIFSAGASPALRVRAYFFIFLHRRKQLGKPTALGRALKSRPYFGFYKFLTFCTAESQLSPFLPLTREVARAQRVPEGENLLAVRKNGA